MFNLLAKPTATRKGKILPVPVALRLPQAPPSARGMESEEIDGDRKLMLDQPMG
jgi:hypothetical protein